MLPIVLVAAALGSLLTHGTGAQRLRMARVSIATMQMRETMRFRLTGCLAGGIGVGLDPANVVDFLRPGAPAAQYLRIGDVVVNIDEVSLLDPVTGQQRKLKDAVNTSLSSSPAPSHRSRKKQHRLSAPKRSEGAHQARLHSLRRRCRRRMAPLHFTRRRSHRERGSPAGRTLLPPGELLHPSAMSSGGKAAVCMRFVAFVA